LGQCPVRGGHDGVSHGDCDAASTRHVEVGDQGGDHLAAAIAAARVGARVALVGEAWAVSTLRSNLSAGMKILLVIFVSACRCWPDSPGSYWAGPTRGGRAARPW